MTQKNILISIGIVLGVAVLVVGGLIALKQFMQPAVDQPPVTQADPQPGDRVAADKTPDYSSCSVVTQQMLETVDTKTILSVQPGSDSGVVAPNYEIAQKCTYTFTSASSQDNTLDVLIYLYAPTDTTESGASYDTSWINISKGQLDYALAYPAYFKATTADGKKASTLQIINGARNYRFTITQPESAALDDMSALKLMLSIANKADYKAADSANSSDIPAAPKTE